MSLVPEVISRTVARNALHLQKASPEVLLGVGIIGLVGSTVLACRATLKVEEVLSTSKDKVDLATNLEHDNYSEKDRQRDLMLIKYQTGVKIVKLYAPPLSWWSFDLCLTSSHNILSRRNAALTAAYAALEKGFNQYRARG
jgi:hypothetical protein